jgi:hypothetical protein
MLVLSDQGIPVPLRQFLPEHSVRTAAEQLWSTLANGQLLAAAEAAGFDVLVTTDKNMRYQQNVTSRRIAVVVLGQGRWPVVRLHVRRVATAVNAAQPGTFTDVEMPEMSDRP